MALFGVCISYIATSGSAFLGLDEGDKYFKSDVFLALSESGFGIALYFLPLIPLICGYFFQKTKKAGNYWSAGFILVAILLLDVAIGYALAEAIYKGEYLRGLHEQEWKSEYIFSDITFYIVFALNFIMYMAFSLVANAVMEERDKLNPSAIVVKLQNQIDRLKEIIEDLKNKIIENKKAIESNLSEIEKNQMTIEKKQRDIDAYKAGKLPINIEDLKGLIDQFLRGYQAYTNTMIEDSEKAKSIVNRAYQNTENWFKNKMENGWSNDVEISFNKNVFNID